MIFDIIVGIVIIIIALRNEGHIVVKAFIILLLLGMLITFHESNAEAAEENIFNTNIHIRNEMNYPKGGEEFFSQWIHGTSKNDVWGFGFDYKHVEELDLYKIEPFLIIDLGKPNIILGYSDHSGDNNSVFFGFNSLFRTKKFCIFWELKNFSMIDQGDSYLSNFAIATCPIGKFHIGVTTFQDIYWNYSLKEKSTILGGIVFGYNFDSLAICTRLARSYKYTNHESMYSNRVRVDLKLKF